MKYTVTLSGHLPGGDAENGATREKIVLESRAGESSRHIALKILAYALLSHEAAPLRLHIEQSVHQRHKPDLVAVDPDNEARVRWWIDCGQIETKRLGRIVRSNGNARVVVVKSTAREAEFYVRAALPFLPDDAAHRTEFVGFDEAFLPDFLDALRGTNRLHVGLPTGAAARFDAALNGHDFSTDLSRFCAADR